MADPLINLVQPGDEPGKNDGSQPKIDLLQFTEKASISSAASSASDSRDDMGAFSNIFTQTKSAEKDSRMVKSIIAQKEALQKLKPILGSAPNLEKTLEQEKEYRLKRKLRLVQFAFTFFLIAGLGIFFYFYTELSPGFNFWGSNVTHRLNDVNINLRKLQTRLNKARYLAAQLDLNEFSYQADRFFENITRSQDAALVPAQKNQYLEEAGEAKKAMPELLTHIRTNLTGSFLISTFRSEAEPLLSEEDKLTQAESDLRILLREDRKGIAQNSTNPEDLENVKLIDNTVKLVGNKELISRLQNISIDDFKKSLDDYQAQSKPQKEQILRDLTGTILSSTKSDLAIIADVKRKRIGWSTIIQQIEIVTTGVDPVYGQPLLANGNSIVYTGYEFDTATNKIVLSGNTRTQDGNNFTLMSDLMARLEQSPVFEDVDMRSFSKTKEAVNTGNQGYLANFKIDLRLEGEKFSDKNQKISLENTSASAPVSRTVPANS